MKSAVFRWVVLGGLVALAGCGGGGGSSVGGGAGGGGGGSGDVTAASVSGTAATGVPFEAADISVMDGTGAVVGSTMSAADGSYSIELPAGATGPFVVQAVRDDQTLVSVAASPGTVNITPVTHLIAARLAESGDPTKLASEFAANPGQVTTATIDARVTEVVAVLQPLLDAVGTTGNPLTTSFAANGDGMDRVLDSLSVKIVPDSATSTNIEVAIKQKSDSDDTQPVPRQFSSAAATIAPLPVVDATKLVKPGTAPLITALLAKMTACYALPAAQRVTTENGANQTAANITAPACREIFYNDDPSTFKGNGRLVGSTPATNAFANIFRSGGDGLVFDRATYEFTRPNGDIVIGYRSTDVNGNVTNDVFVVRPDNAAAPTKVQHIGNQYNLDGAVKPYHQLRTFVNQGTSDYLSTGYAIAINNTPGVFDEVVVTTPRRGLLTLKPKNGYATLQLEKGSTVTGTSFLRLRSVYTSPTRANEDPMAADTKMFSSPTAFPDENIVQIPQQAVWTFQYYLAGTLVGTQNYRTRARALSIGELKQQQMADLTPQAIAGITGATSFPAPTAGVVLDWLVGTGALAPTSLAVWGFVGTQTPSTSFSDGATVGSTFRTGTVRCVKKSGTDAHCATGAVTGVPANFAAGSQINGLHLFARDAVGREYAHFYATYLINGGDE